MANQPNYTAEQVAALIDAAPVSYDDAVIFAAEWEKSPKSVIAKIKSLDLEYIPKAKPKKRPTQETKAQIVEDIQAMLEWELMGLTRATTRSLLDLRGAILEYLPDTAEKMEHGK